MLKIKTNIKMVFSRLLIAIFVIFSIANFAVYALDTAIEAYGTDTVAGVETYLRTSAYKPYADVSFEVTKPNDQVVKVSATTNGNGVAVAKFSDYWTRQAGEYSVVVRDYTAGLTSGIDTFEVFADSVSTSTSTVLPANQVVRIGSDSGDVTVTLVDDYGNPVEGHVVQLISSSSDDLVVYAGEKTTDMNGEISFLVSSDIDGAVTYTAYDVTSEITLSDRVKVAYFNTSDYMFSSVLGADSYYAAGAGSGEVDYLEFEDIPGEIAVGEPISFTVAAYDDAGQLVEDYDGEVRFSAVGVNGDYVDLPGDYEFSLADLGSHTFSLALLFQQEGSYTVEVRDIDDIEIYGECDFEAVSDSGDAVSGGGITLSSPVAGSYSNPVQVITGTAEAGDSVKIFDNDVQVALVEADVSGNFTYTTGVLEEGSHVFYAASVNEVGTIIDTSDTVMISIDSTSTEITQLEILPDTAVDPNVEMTVRMYVDGALSQASIIVDGNIYEFSETPFEYFETEFASPIEFGDYGLTFVLVDDLGNETKQEDLVDITVGPSSLTNAVSGPGDVTGVQADYADHKVVLAWDAVTIGDNPIDHYRIYYGTSQNDLSEAVDTFTDSTTWYVPNLENGVAYYFAVIAVDTLGNVSSYFSDVVSAMPNPKLGDTEIVDPCVATGTCGGDALGDLEGDVSDTGPEILWLVLLSAMGGVAYCSAKKARG